MDVSAEVDGSGGVDRHDGLGESSGVSGVGRVAGQREGRDGSSSRSTRVSGAVKRLSVVDYSSETEDAAQPSQFVARIRRYFLPSGSIARYSIFRGTL